MRFRMFRHEIHCCTKTRCHPSIQDASFLPFVEKCQTSLSLNQKRECLEISQDLPRNLSAVCKCSPPYTAWRHSEKKLFVDCRGVAREMQHARFPQKFLHDWFDAKEGDEDSTLRTSVVRRTESVSLGSRRIPLHHSPTRARS
jgi:hypothetical protein